jgi:hypothetical protein
LNVRKSLDCSNLDPRRTKAHKLVVIATPSY